MNCAYFNKWMFLCCSFSKYIVQNILFNSKYIKNNPAHNRWSFTKNDPFLFEIPPEAAFDIDYPWQFEVGEVLYKKNILK